MKIKANDIGSRRDRYGQRERNDCLFRETSWQLFENPPESQSNENGCDSNDVIPCILAEGQCWNQDEKDHQKEGFLEPLVTQAVNDDHAARDERDEETGAPCKTHPQVRKLQQNSESDSGTACRVALQNPSDRQEGNGNEEEGDENSRAGGTLECLLEYERGIPNP